MTDNISEEVRSVLSELEITGNHVRIVEQVDRKLYVAVNKVLMRIGGTWNRKVKAHVFKDDPTDLIEIVIESGVLDPKIKTGYFPTPDKIVDKMLDLAKLSEAGVGCTVLEPSAGQGHIADKICGKLGLRPSDMCTCETLPENISVLTKKGYYVRGDFIEFAEQCKEYVEHWTFDRIVMNPPFERQADIDHVTAAFELLAPDGVLMAIMSGGVLFRENRKTKEFRETLLEPHGTHVERLPQGEFKESGTMVNTVLIRLEMESQQ